MRSAAFDPVDKLRVSTPQALIDTDFEYGTQPTKWESIVVQNNRQGCYYLPQSNLVITGITGLNTATGEFTLAGTFVLATGDIVYVQNSLNPDANGWGYVSTGGTNSCTVRMAGGTTIPATNYYNPANTYVYKGIFYSGCGINLSGTSAVTNVGTTITVTTATAHGLSKGSFIYVVGLGGGTPAPNGAFIVATTPTATTFTYTAISAPTAGITNTAGQTNIYARPAGYVEPRAFDGGVAFSSGAAVPNQQLIRQTRRYFRYQSGKGIQFSTGSSLKPQLFTPTITSSGTAIGSTVTVTTPFPHNLTTNCIVRVSNVDQSGYNGDYQVTSYTTLTFTYVATKTLEATTATGVPIRVSPLSWYGASNRVGFFDQQNGFFFEFDGQTLYAVVRNSVTQIPGRVVVTQGSGTVTGTSTTFSTSLKPNDYIVIRGQSYKVMRIASDTSMEISPEYRGATITQGGYTVSKTVETRYAQSTWFDVCDGTSSISNPSGYLLDLTRMQMWYIDYSWYGAGVIRFGFRAKDGAVTYVHSVQNNNQRFEAYMRSGNMSAHYESNGQMPATYITATLSSSETSAITVADTSGFAPTGQVVVRGNSAASVTNGIEYINYTGKTSTSITGLTRAQTGGQASGVTFTYSATSPQAVEYVSPDTAPSLSHWGSSVIMDGLYNDDKSLLFNYGMTTAITTTTLNQTTTVLAIRIAPSADNGTTATLGNKEIINRMQLQLTELGLFTTGAGYFIQLFLNGYASAAFTGSFVSPTAPTSSLAQVALNTTLGTSITNGESVAAAYTNQNGVTTLDLTQVRDLGNSILGGGINNTVPTTQAGFYPDGPDILYVVATSLSATSSTLVARLSWKEAQA
tara:strand:+ start:12710 stop:15274 length:2565 start_codon:yes stop_codon:yes gene_type:complete